MDSGNAFDGDSPGPSSPVGEQSLAISWTDSFKNNPTSQGHEITIGEEQSNKETSSSGHKRWSCVNLISTISLRDGKKISTKYGVEVRFPQETGRLHNPHAGYVIVSESFLKFGVRFLLHPYFVRILNHYNLIVFQLSPNGWAQMIGIFVLFAEQKMELPTPKEFSWFYTLKSCQSNFRFYYFSKRTSKDIQAVIRIKDSLGTWKDTYFYTYEENVRGSFAESSKFLVVIFPSA